MNKFEERTIKSKIAQDEFLQENATEILTMIIEGEIQGKTLAEEVGIPPQNLAKALIDPLDNQDVITAATGNIYTKTKRK
jgi:hypothetical protein